ncbi:MAG TPA: hypothetical protein PKD53_17295 [Chloroflexaceae bacterium]|nr:hypothetical protein [Chloroflexaceae bacterium]
MPGILGMAAIWRQTDRQAEARRGYRRALRQLAGLEPEAPVPGADGSAAEPVAYARTELELLG